MIKIANRRLPPPTYPLLAAYQAEVAGTGGYAARVGEGKRLFRSRNRAGNAAFREVRQVLRRMCRGPNRCMYCEDSSADQIDHFRPKDFYPDHVFVWANYLWACGRCNRRKGNRFHVYRGGVLPLVPVRPAAAPLAAVPRGRPALLNPRSENPLDRMMLDLGTFDFVPTDPAGSLDRERTEETIAALGLNDRGDVVEARKDAFRSYRARLAEYATAAEQGAAADRLADLRTSILQMPHPTVWSEMVRQRQRRPELRALFARVPAAVNW